MDLLTLTNKALLEKFPELKKFRDELEKNNSQAKVLLRHIDTINEQMRGMQQTMVEMQKVVTQLTTDQQRAKDVLANMSPPGFINHVDNSDFSFTDEGYSGATYTNKAEVAARWYARFNGTTSQEVENTTGTESADSLRNNTTRRTTNGNISGAPTTNLTTSGSFFLPGDVNAHVVIFGAGTAGAPHITTIASYTSGTQVTLTAAAQTNVSGATVVVMPRPTYWDKASGLAIMGYDWSLYHPLVKNIAAPGQVVYVRFQIKKNPEWGVIPGNYGIRAAIWDNTSGQQKVVEGSTWQVSASPTFAAPGIYTRKYILRVDSTAGPFYSDVISPATVNNQVSVDNIDNVNYVNVSWMSFPEASRYTLYRFDSQHNEWRTIAQVTNGSIQFQDKGGRSGDTFSPPGANVNAKAQTILSNFLDELEPDFVSFIFAIRVPSNYTYASTADKQWLRIDIVDQNGALAQISPGSLFIDKVAVGYNNGAWTMSARDVASAAAIATTTPPPSNVPGGLEPVPDPGTAIRGTRTGAFQANIN